MALTCVYAHTCILIFLQMVNICIYILKAWVKYKLQNTPIITFLCKDCDFF